MVKGSRRRSKVRRCERRSCEELQRGQFFVLNLLSLPPNMRDLSVHAIGGSALGESVCDDFCAVRFPKWNGASSADVLESEVRGANVAGGEDADERRSFGSGFDVGAAALFAVHEAEDANDVHA